MEEAPALARSMLSMGFMSKMVFEVRQKNGSLVTARLGATNHSEEARLGAADVAIGIGLFSVAAGFVLFLLTV